MIGICTNSATAYRSRWDEATNLLVPLDPLPLFAYLLLVPLFSYQMTTGRQLLDQLLDQLLESHHARIQLLGAIEDQTRIIFVLEILMGLILPELATERNFCFVAPEVL